MTAEQRLHQQNQQVYVNGNDGSGPGLLLPADIAESLTAVYGHTDSASLSEPNQNLDTNIISNELKDDSISGSLHPEGPTVSASPTKYILNNHKLEERKRDLELRRRNKNDKKVATEEHLNEIKRKMEETRTTKKLLPRNI